MLNRLRLLPPGCDGGHILSPEQERPSGPGACGLLHSGPAEGGEEDHLYRPVIFNPAPTPPVNSDLVLTSTGPPLLSLLSSAVRWDRLLMDLGTANAK